MAGVNSVVPDSTAPPSAADQGAVDPSAPTVLPDQLIDLARAAAIEEAGADAGVGDYLGARSEDSIASSASFAATDRGYRGWYWLVTLAVVDPARPTISEVVLLPGDGALLAPAWVPWDQRVRAGDLGVGDLLPTTSDDDRLVPGYLDSDDPAVREVDYEFGFGRVRVLGRQGRDEAAQRWHDGPFGPDDPMAQQAPGVCGTCGFYVRLEGLLGQAFGACTNEFSPADGRVVDVSYGCGAHSETVVDAPLISASTAAVVDEVTLEVHHRPVVESGPVPESAPVPGVESGPMLEAEPEPEPVPESVPVPGAKSGPVPEAEPDSVPEPGSVSEPAPDVAGTPLSTAW